MFICIASNKQKSSEVLTAKQMSFELFCECVNGKRRGLQFDRQSVPCRWPGQCEVTTADGGPLCVTIMATQLTAKVIRGRSVLNLQSSPVTTGDTLLPHRK